MRRVGVARSLWGVGCLLLLCWPAVVAALTLEARYVDGVNEGFNDPVIGAARRGAFEAALDMWGQALDGTVPVVVDIAMDPLGGTGTNAILASTGTTTLHTGFFGSSSNSVYGAALGNQLSQRDVNGPERSEMRVTFNADVDGPTVLGSVGFYYGSDTRAGSDIDFITVALHELGHGLNFFDLIDPGGGGWLAFDLPGIFDRQVRRLGVGSLATMRNAERVAAITSGMIVWNGPSVVASAGVPVPLYAPAAYQSGSSVSHWDTTLAPDELIEPFYTTPNHDLGLLLPAMADMGWRLAGPTPTLPPATITPTATTTRSPLPTRTSTPGPRPRRTLAYVTNFDSDDVSVIDLATRAVVATIPVQPGPIGVAVSRDGARAFVASFQSGTLSIIDTASLRVHDTVPIGDSANGVVLTPDDATVFVSDTAGDAVVAVDATTGATLARIPTGAQPSGMALTPDGRRVFVAEFGTNTMAVIDTELKLTRARFSLGEANAGPIAIALDARHGIGYVAMLLGRFVQVIDTAELRRDGSNTLPLPNSGPVRGPVAIALTADGAMAYVATQREDSGVGEVLPIATASGQVNVVIEVGDNPEALALTADGELVLVANAGSDTVSLIEARRQRVTATIPVGTTPMGIAIGVVPLCPGDCDGDGRVVVDELVTAVNLALTQQPVTPCPAVDRNANGVITIDELVAATDTMLEGCP